MTSVQQEKSFIGLIGHKVFCLENESCTTYFPFKPTTKWEKNHGKISIHCRIHNGLDCLVTHLHPLDPPELTETITENTFQEEPNAIGF